MTDVAELEGFYDDDQQDLLYWFTVGFGILSMLGQTMVFCVFICLKLESPISGMFD